MAPLTFPAPGLAHLCRFFCISSSRQPDRLIADVDHMRTTSIPSNHGTFTNHLHISRRSAREAGGVAVVEAIVPTRPRLPPARSDQLEADHPAGMAGSFAAPHVQDRDRGFAVWADEYVRNESKAASTAGELRRIIAQRLRALPPAEGELLSARYAGSRWHGTDVENLLFNNIDQTLSLFAAPANAGVRFHDLGTHAPADPARPARATTATTSSTPAIRSPRSPAGEWSARSRRP
jgi:hypothetical protein